VSYARVQQQRSTRSTRAALGDIGVLPGNTFFWTALGWYYLYAWAPGVGWDAGRWVRGSDLCAAANAALWGAGSQSVRAAWFAIWSHAKQKMVLYAPVGSANHPMCYFDDTMYAQGMHFPGEIVS